MIWQSRFAVLIILCSTCEHDTCGEPKHYTIQSGVYVEASSSTVDNVVAQIDERQVIVEYDAQDGARYRATYTITGPSDGDWLPQCPF